MKTLRYFLSLALVMAALFPASAQKGNHAYKLGNSLTNNLIAFWDLDETSGSRAAAWEALSSLTLTDNNTVGNAAGKIRNAGQFVLANSEYLSITDNAALSMGDIDFSIVAWVFFDTLPSGGADRGIVVKWQSGVDREYALFATDIGGGNSRFQFDVRNTANTTTTSVQASSFGTPSTSTWYMLYCHHDAATDQIAISVNAGSLDLQGASGGVRDAANNFVVGAFSNPTSYFDGRIDMPMIWKRLLADHEITRLYNSGNGAIPLTN